MTPVQKLEAAIAKLETQRAAADQGVWATGWDGQEFFIAGSEAGESWAGYKDRVAESTYAIMPGRASDMAECNTANFELIVTLHRTIESQIALLADGVIEIAQWTDLNTSIGWEPWDGPTPKSAAFKHRMNLADAILGADS